MRDEWADDVAARAREHWTDERLAELARGKTLLIDPREGAVLLRALGILHRDGSMPADRARKFFQINHMVAAIGPSLRELVALDRPLRVVDAACGSSYLNLLLVWVLSRRYATPVEVVGLERRPALVEAATERAKLAGLSEHVHYVAADLTTSTAADVRHAFAARFGHDERPVDVLLALHACDVATDEALRLAVELDVRLVAASPCCQAELAKAWAALPTPSAFAPIHRSPHLRREAAASITDAMRAELLRAVGYEVAALEFVPTEHSAKNTLLRAMKRGGAVSDSAFDAYEQLREATGGAGITLAEHLASRTQKPLR